MRNILMRTFGRPQGPLGRLGGLIMARMNADCGSWVCDLLEVEPSDSVLEVGFGPGVVIQYLSKLVTAGHVAGIDQSREMVEQARARNTTAIQRGCVDLRHGSVESLPFDDNSFDKALAINSMQVWSDAVAGLREIRRVMKPGGRIALGFTPYSGQPNKGLTETLIASGFTQAHVVEAPKAFCALATRP
jgi:ubiquinone/menaquinone biosynthesis C-methylase UbiE